MTFWTLDLVPSSEGSLKFIEINGLGSAFGGFGRIYDDDRVRDDVERRLVEKHGRIMQHTSPQFLKEMVREKPFHAEMYWKFRDLVNFFLISSNAASIISTEGFDYDWMPDMSDFEYRPESNAHLTSWTFPEYDGSDCTVLNWRSEPLPHPTINPLVGEALAKNKFLLYRLMKDTKLGFLFPTTILVGMGATDIQGLEGLLDSEHEEFIIKPLVGAGGLGIEKKGKKEIEEMLVRGPLVNFGLGDYLSFMLGEIPPRYLQDFIEQDEFLFELGMKVVQPFVDSKGFVSPFYQNCEDAYACLRLVVCNGELVDYYVRVDEDSVVSLTRSADALNVKIGGLDRFAPDFIETFESACSELNPETYRRDLYRGFLDETGRVTDEQKIADMVLPLKLLGYV